MRFSFLLALACCSSLACANWSVQLSVTSNAAPGTGLSKSDSININKPTGRHALAVESASASRGEGAGVVGIGHLAGSAFASAGTFIDNDFTYGANASGRAFGSYVDLLTFTGSPGQMVTLRFGLAATGTLTGGFNAPASVKYRLATSDGSEIEYDERINSAGVRQIFRDQRADFFVTRAAGTRLSISGFFDVQASGAATRPGGNWVIGSSSADFSHTFVTEVESITPGGGYVSDSGTIFAVPEPGTICALGIGLLLIRRRRS